MSKIEIPEIELGQDFNKFVVAITGIVVIITQWKAFYDYFVPNHISLNSTGIVLKWDAFFLISLFIVFCACYFMSHLSKKKHEEIKTLLEKEHNALEIIKKDRDNLIASLKDSERRRLTDVITGIPNMIMLENEINRRKKCKNDEDELSVTKNDKKMQAILMDLNNFKQINDKYTLIKADDLLRTIAQTIYKGMRRNENMYKCKINSLQLENEQDCMYRVYPGGDEFIFTIFGDQADALGFVNRLVGIFESLSNITEGILGEHLKLSFCCAVCEIDSHDDFTSMYEKLTDCYKRTKEGTADFVIYWDHFEVEKELSEKENKLAIYKKTRQLFQVMTMSRENYDLSDM